MQARQGSDAAPSLLPAPVSPRSVTANPRQSNIIKVDVQQVREILTYLSQLEQDRLITDDEVYELESLVTVQKDQLILSYYMTFKDNPDVFVKRCRRHLQNLARPAASLTGSVIENQ